MPLSLVVLLCCVTRILASDCELSLHLDASQSTFDVDGVAESDLLGTIDLIPAHTQQRIGMFGILKWKSGGGCPANSRQLRRALSDEGFSLAAQEMALYPSNASVNAESLAIIHFLDLKFGYRWTAVNDGRSSDGIIVDSSLEVLGGDASWAVNVSFGLVVDPGMTTLDGLISEQSQETQLILNRSTLIVDMPESIFTFSTSFETGLDLMPTLNVTLNLRGRLVAEGNVECSQTSCANNGRCSIEDGDQICVCACGWTGDDCSVPSGFCNPFEDRPTSPMLESAQEMAMVTISETALEEQCQQLFSARQCPDTRSTFDSREGECTCIDGWRGNDCDLCERSDACADFFEEGAMCLRDSVYDARSGGKLYECDVRTTGLATFIGNSLKFVCNTTGPRFYDPVFQEELRNDPSISPVNNTPFCEVQFAFQETTEVRCTTWGCMYQPGSTKVTCADTICECTDCDVVSGLVGAITGVTLECGDDECEVFFDGLSVAINAPCNIAECLLPSNPDFTAIFREDNGFKVNWNLLIISTPLVLLVILLLIFGIPTVLLARDIAAPSTSNAAPMSKSKQGSGAEISFRNVSCSVPLHTSFSNSIGDWLRPWMWHRLRRKTPSVIRHQDQLNGLETSLQHQLIASVGYKAVLHGVSGTVRRGQLMGVMGPSGGGKTTFLSIICGISADGSLRRKLNGDIVINGREIGKWAQRVVAFVPQYDKLLSTLTVKECLMYSALLRKPNITMSEIKSKVMETLRELGLQNVEHTQVGGVRNRRGISGGERRRVSIGMELVIDPDLIIMDEPTSGLDSFTALNLMQAMKHICMGGRTVILSVHQPTPQMVDMLDQVLLLAKGFQVYLGPPGEATDFFQMHGLVREDASKPMAEFMLEVVSSPRKLVPLLNAIHRNREAEIALDTWKDKGVEGKTERPDNRSSFMAMRVLLWRGYLDIVRNAALLKAHVSVALLIGLFCGSIFYKADLTIEGAQNRLGSMFFVLAFLGFWSLTTIDLLHVERSIVARETSGGYYNSYAYLISKILLDSVLLRVLPAVLLTMQLYFMMHLQRTAEKFAIFILTVSTFNMTVGLLSMGFTLLSPSPGTASLLINTVLLVGLLFAGHLVNIPSMPHVVRWVHHLSPFHYGFQVLAVNEMLGLRLNFIVPGYASVEGIGGDVFLRTIGIEDQNIRGDLIAFVVYYGISFVLAFVAMWLSRHAKSVGRRFKDIFCRFLSFFA